MNQLNIDEVRKYVNEGIAGFYQQRMKLLQELTFHELLGKGFCLFRPMRPTLAGDIVEVLLDAFLCSSGEQLFESFLKDLRVVRDFARKTWPLRGS